MIVRLGAIVVAFLAVLPFGADAADTSLSAAANVAFLAQNAQQRGVVVRPSGLQYKIIKNGFGRHPKPTDHVTVYYTGKLINGNVFDGTEPELPAQFTTKDLIPGWSEALQLMREGDRWQLVIPAKLAYGSRGAGNGAIPPNQTLVFDLELVTVPPPSKEEQAQQAAEKQKESEDHSGPGAE